MADMARYRFYPKADAAQDRIWRETFDRWGERQADYYIGELHRHLERLSETRSLWRKLPQALVIHGSQGAQAYFSRYAHHYIFFRELDDGAIGIISILHERMDLPARLKADLMSLLARGIRL